MVSQANFFMDDISGDLFPTPAEAIESERKSLVKYIDFIPAMPGGM